MVQIGLLAFFRAGRDILFARDGKTGHFCRLLLPQVCVLKYKFFRIPKVHITHALQCKRKNSYLLQVFSLTF